MRECAPCLASISNNGALLLLTKGVTPLLQNHSRRVGFPTTPYTLSRGRSLSIVESDGVNKSMPPPPPTHTQPNPHPLSGFCTGKYSDGHGMVIFPSCCKFHCFLQFESIIPALWCLQRACVALIMANHAPRANTRGLLLVKTRPQSGGTPPLYGPQNGCTEQCASSAPEAPEILFWHPWVVKGIGLRSPWAPKAPNSPQAPEPLPSALEYG